MENGQSDRADARTILVVEDDLDTREFYELLLVSAGFHPLTAGTGQAALARVRTEKVQGVLLDRRLPDMDGVTICRHLRERLGPEVPIIVVTADHDDTLEGMARQAGATDFLRKPFDPAEMLRRLERLTAPSLPGSG